MGKGKTNYILRNENGEIKEICGMREVANFLGVVDSTVYKYQDVDKPYNGWYITRNGFCDCSPRTRQVKRFYKSKNKYIDIDNNWCYQTFYPPQKTILVYKSFKIPAKTISNYETLDLDVKKAVRLLVNRLKKDVEDYIVYSEIPTFFNVNDNIKYNLYYLELHFKFKEMEEFYDWVNFLNPYIKNLDNYISNFS